MGIVLKLKAYLIAAALLVGAPISHTMENTVGSFRNAGARFGAALQDGMSRHVRVTNVTVPLSPNAPPKHVNLAADDKKAAGEQDKTFAELPTVTSMSFTVGNPNPFQKPKKNAPSSTPRPSPMASAGAATPAPTPKPKPKSLPIVLPATTHVPEPSPALTPQQTSALPSPNFDVGTLLIGSNPQTVKINSVVEFTVFVRNALGAAVKNTSLTFLVNGNATLSTTDDTGNARLAYQLPAGILGKFDITVKLGSQSAAFSVMIVDTKPVLSLSAFAFTLEGYHVRLRNALAEYVPNWQVTAYKRDGSITATLTTNELGVIEFPLPPRENGGHLYACAEVKDVGRQCTEW